MGELDGEANLQRMLVVNEGLFERMDEGLCQTLRHNSGALGVQREGCYRQYDPESIVDKERERKKQNDCATRFVGHFEAELKKTGAK